jgi:AraC-like DNA-binding protein
MRKDVGRCPGSERQVAGLAGPACGLDLPASDFADQAATVRYVTDDLPQCNRVARWREHISNCLVEMEFEPDHPSSGFDGVIVARSLHDLQLLKMTFTAAQLVRRSGDDAGSDCFLLHINAGGTVVVSSAERVLVLNEGQAVLLDGAQPFRIHRQGVGSSYVVRIPRLRMVRLVFLAETIVMRRLSGASGASTLFTACMDTILLHADRSSPPVRQLTYRHFTDLLTILFDPDETHMAEMAERGALSDERRGMPDVRLRSAKAYIIAHAHEQIFIGQVADHLGVTERHLQRQFGNHGTTFTALLNDVRLARAHAMLCDQYSDKLRIRSICFKTGFRDVSHFNRAFRARYGCTPAAVRKTRGPDLPRRREAVTDP